MDDIFDTLFGIPYGGARKQDTVGSTKVGDYLIVTCWTVDQGYETAISKLNHDWVVVQRYATRDEAVRGHSDWMSACALEPDALWSVQLDMVVNL